jgi:hypothetical protein
MFMGQTQPYWLFLAIGLLIVIYEGHRQFNKPVYMKSEDSDRDRDWLSSLSPGDIRGNSAFFSSELVYLAILVLLYLSITFSDSVRLVIFFIVDFIGNGATGGGEVPQVPTDSQLPATGVDDLRDQSDDLTNAAMPFLTSVTMVTALRFPIVARIEGMIRSFSQQLFGIPTIPHRRRVRIEQTPISIDEIEDGLPTDADTTTYSARISHMINESAKLDIQVGDIKKLERDLSKLAAYQIWVGDLGIWPSIDLRAKFALFKERNGPLIQDIDQLFRDLGFLLSRSADPELAETGQKLRRELWETKAKRASELTNTAVDLMTLFEQKSLLPKKDVPGSTGLRIFIKKVRAIDEVRVAQINLALILILVCVFANSIFGGLHAIQLKNIALELGLVTTASMGRLGHQIDVMGSAKIWAGQAFLAYGLSVWVAIWYRQKQSKSDKWRAFFDLENTVPPMFQFLKLVAVIVVTVTLIYLAISLTRLDGWDFSGERNDEWWQRVQEQFSIVLRYVTVGTIHAVAIVLFMDMAEARRGWKLWGGLIVVYVVVMAISGVLLGYSSQLATTPPEITNMRIVLYAADMTMIALLTSLWLSVFRRVKRTNATAMAEFEEATI